VPGQLQQQSCAQNLPASLDNSSRTRRRQSQPAALLLMAVAVLAAGLPLACASRGDMCAPLMLLHATIEGLLPES